MKTFDGWRATFAGVAGQVRKAHGAGGTTHVAMRRNIKVAGNVGKPGGAARAVAVQSAPITQPDEPPRTA